MSIVALDIGTRRIGIAVAPAGLRLAVPLDPIDRTNLKSDIEAVVRVIEERAAETVVVGDPLTLLGQRGFAAEKIDGFVKALTHRWRGTIKRIDERLTTAQANRTLLAIDTSRAKRKRLVDGMAAALILETYIGRLETR